MIDERGMLMGSVRLKELERRSSILVQRSDLTVDDEVGLQRFKSIAQDRVILIEKLAVAREELNLGSRFERECAVPIELDFVDPIAGRQFRDRERQHRFDERTAV